MKYIVSLMCLFVLTSCSYNSPDEKTITELVEITRDDLDIFEKLNTYIYEDIDTIRAMADKLIPAYADKTFLLTNSFYLSKIDSTKYNELMKILKTKYIFEDWIEVSTEGVAKYRIKSGVYNDLFHVHELVYVGKTSSFDTQYEYIITDSIVDENWKYIYL